MEHILKVRKKNFEPILNGDLTFVIRKVDRVYSVGDRLVLFEVDGQKETGRSLIVLIRCIMHSEDSEGIKEDYCVISIKRSGKNTRTNAGNHPNSVEEAIEYASKIGKSEDCARRFFDYYSMSGWKMKSGLPLSDWHAALRNWKDYSANQRSPEDQSADQQLELLLPLLLKKASELSKNAKDLEFNDPHVATVLKFYGFDRFDYPFNAFEVKEMVKHYNTSKALGTGIERMRGPNPYAKGTIKVPNIEEFARILQHKKENKNVHSEQKEPILNM